MSDCKVYRREIVEAFEGDALSRAARAHAESCRACGDELRGRENLRALVRGLAKVEAPADFDYRLRARMSASGTRGRRSPLRGLRLVYAFAPVAAAACFLVVSATLYLRQASQTSAPEAPAHVATGAAQNTVERHPEQITTVEEVGVSYRADGRSAEVATGATPSQTRLRVDRRREASRPPRDVAARHEAQARVQRNTIEASVFSARVITGRGVPFALKTTAEPMRMILRDERGVGRVVPMRAVSFGAQELIARESVSRQASAAENEGVW